MYPTCLQSQILKLVKQMSAEVPGRKKISEESMLIKFYHSCDKIPAKKQFKGGGVCLGLELEGMRQLVTLCLQEEIKRDECGHSICFLNVGPQSMGRCYPTFRVGLTTLIK